MTKFIHDQIPTNSKNIYQLPQHDQDFNDIMKTVAHILSSEEAQAYWEAALYNYLGDLGSINTSIISLKNMIFHHKFKAPDNRDEHLQCYLHKQGISKEGSKR